jgi:nucleotidyltransferase substrate binding protein (TIGR01987 family)
LEEEGFMVNSPRGAIKLAFQAGVLEDGHVWIEALKDRNLTVHTYEKKLRRPLSRRLERPISPPC